MAEFVGGVEALNERILRNVVYEGGGLDGVVVHACPFCGAPGWLRMSLAVPPVDGGPGECHCSECGRTGRLDIVRGAGVVTLELVQTGGPPLPDWYHPVPRLEGAAAEAAERWAILDVGATRRSDRLVWRAAGGGWTDNLANAARYEVAEADRLREPGYAFPVRMSRAQAYAVAVVQVPRSCPIWDDATAHAAEKPT